MSTTAQQHTFKAFFDSAIARRLAPGAQWTIFNRSQPEFLINGATGLSTLPTPSNPDGVHMTPENPHWLASAGKLAVSLLVLMVLERGIAKNKMSFGDLDDHEKLVEILPEFKHGSGHWVTQLITGFAEGHDEKGRKIPILRDTKNKVTLRQLLTHTAGLGYSFGHPLLYELYTPTDGSVPLKQPLGSGLIDSFDIPCVFEPGTTVHYSVSVDWLGQFVIRTTGLNLREALKKYIFEPLSMSPEECDAAKTPAIASRLSELYLKQTSEDGNTFTPFSFDLSEYSEEGEPPAGSAHLATAPIWASTQTYSKLLHAVLRHDTRLLADEASWVAVDGDALKGTGIEVPIPRSVGVPRGQVPDIEFYSEPVDRTKHTSMSLLGCDFATSPTRSGRPEGSWAWAGAGHSFYVIDPVNGLGWFFSVQVFPFYEKELVELRDEFEKLVYATFTR